MINFEEFVQQYYPNTDNNKQNDLKRFILNVEGLAKNSNIKESLKDSRFVCKTFFMQKGCCISRPHYQKIKKYLTDLSKYLGVDFEIPSRDDVLASQEMLTYFGSIDDVLDFINEMGIKNVPDFDKRIDLVYLKSLVVLGWRGLTANQIVNIKKTDCFLNNNQGYIKGDEFEVLLNKKETEVIAVLINTESYKGYPSGKLIRFKGSESYLFRPTSSSVSAPIEENTLLHALRRFNDANDSLRMITFRSLRKNGAFEDVYKDKSEASLYIKIMKRFNCDRIVAIGISREYNRWVELFKK